MGDPTTESNAGSRAPHAAASSGEAPPAAAAARADARGPAPRLPLGAKGEPPRYFDDPVVAQVLSMVVALAGEMAVMRDRLDSVERLLDAGQPVTRDAIDRFLPDETVRAERDAWRQQFLSMVFRVLHEERERLAREPASTYAHVVEQAERG